MASVRIWTGALVAGALLFAPIAASAQAQGQGSSQGSSVGGGQGNAQGDPQRRDRKPRGLLIAVVVAAGLAVAVIAASGSNGRPVSGN